jgi:hypothetical protein
MSTLGQLLSHRDTNSWVLRCPLGTGRCRTATSTPRELDPDHFEPGTFPTRLRCDLLWREKSWSVLPKMRLDIRSQEDLDEMPRALREQAVGRELQRIYDDVAGEPIPRNYLELLRRIYDEAWIFPIAWAAEEKPKRLKWLGLFRALREFFLAIGQKLPH